MTRHQAQIALTLLITSHWFLGFMWFGWWYALPTFAMVCTIYLKTYLHVQELRQIIDEAEANLEDMHRGH